MPQEGGWGRYIRAARTAAGLSVAALARRIGTSRETVFRWEAGKYRPDSADVVRRIAEVLGLPLDDVLAAAGFRPTAPPPPEPARPPDPELDLIRQHPRLSAQRKEQLIRYILARRARDEQARMEDLHHLIGE